MPMWHKGVSLLFLALATGGASAVLQVAESGGNPIYKVVNLLKEIQKEVEKESREDDRSYRKYNCWCKDTDKEKTESIYSAKDSLQDATSALQTSSAELKRLKDEIASIKEQMNGDEETLKAAEAQRKKEKEMFEIEQHESKLTLASVKRALQVLQDATQKEGSSFISVTRGSTKAALLEVHQAVEQHFSKYQNILQKDLFEVLGSIEDVVKAPAPSGVRGALLQTEAGDGPERIIGTLLHMEDKITRDLVEAVEAEKQAVKDFEKLMASKKKGNEALKKKYMQKNELAAGLRESIARIEVQIKRLNKSIDADTVSLEEMRVDCKEEARNYDQRSRARAEEVKAIQGAREILSEGSADAAMKSTSFMQVASVHNAQQGKAARHLAAAAKRSGSVSLLSLGMHANSDNFKEVKEMMDKAREDMKLQVKRLEVKREECKEEIDKTEDGITDTTRERDRAERKSQALKSTLDELSTDLEKLKKDIEESEASLQKASVERKEANKIFQTSMADAQATVDILHRAMKRLKDFYMSLLQAHEHQVEADAPAKGEEYRKSAGGGRVISVLAEVATEAEMAATKLKMSEAYASKAYSRFVKDITESIDSANEAKDSVESQVAKLKSQKAEATVSLASNNAELSKLQDLLKAHHDDCDSLLENFDKRKKDLEDEMAAILEAKDMVAGAK